MYVHIRSKKKKKIAALLYLIFKRSAWMQYIGGGEWTLLELLGWGTIHWHPNNKTKLKGQTLSEPRISITLTEVRRNNYRKTAALHQLFSTKRKPNKKI